MTIVGTTIRNRSVSFEVVHTFRALFAQGPFHLRSGVFASLVADRCRRSIKLRDVHREWLVIRSRSIAQDAQRDLLTEQDGPVG